MGRRGFCGDFSAYIGAGTCFVSLGLTGDVVSTLSSSLEWCVQRVSVVLFNIELLFSVWFSTHQAGNFSFGERAKREVARLGGERVRWRIELGSWPMFEAGSSGEFPR